jgi:LPS-assembly protein
MTFRTRIFITVTLLCHLFLLHALLISQLQAAGDKQSPAGMAVFGLPMSAPPVAEEVTIKARQQEKQGDLYKLHGEAEIDYRSYVLRADEITYDAKTGDVTLTGHVVLDGGSHDEHLTATHGAYNVHTESGKFYDVVGSTGARLHGSTVILTTSNPFSFSGAEVEKVGRDKFIVRHGQVTSCTLPKPKWSFNAQEITVVAGEDAKIYNSTFHLFGVPVFYLPFVEHPVERLPRQSGFLLPHIGNSTIKGFTIGDAFYWAMNRSMDATVGADYYSRRGWAQTGEFRWRPAETAFLNFNYFGVLDRGTPITQTIFVPGVGNQSVTTNPGGEEARLNGEAKLGYDFRGVANIDYLSKFLFRAVYAERFYEAFNNEVNSVGFVSRNTDNYFVNGMASRYQNFQSTQPGDVITIVHAPSGESSTVDRQLGGSPLYWNYSAATEGLSRREPGFVTNDVVGRIDLEPSLSLPLHWKGWSFRPDLILRNTYYTESQTPGTAITLGVPVSDPINRRALEASVEIRPPAVGKIFDRPFMGHKIKHTIEPSFRYHMVTGVDNFREILRFDYRDVLADTNEIEYGITNRLFAKKELPAGCKDGAGSDASSDPAANPACTNPPAREILSWEIAQKYFFDPYFGGALIPGARNVFTTTVDLTGIAFLVEPRNYSPIISRLRVNGGSRTDVDWQLDYDTVRGRINSSMAFVTYKVSRDVSFSGGQAFVRAVSESVTGTTITPETVFNQFRMQLNYGSLSRRGFNAGGLVGYDANLRFLQYAAVQTTYNWDCCGFTFEYRRYNFGTIRDESQYRFVLTLANIGTFGTLRKQERLY